MGSAWLSGINLYATVVALGLLHAVKFVATTNGDAGHPVQGGAPLARRRRLESKQVAKILGIEYDVMDVHDGELMPSLENRLEIIRKIREWQADIVLSPRPNDYHPAVV